MNRKFLHLLHCPDTHSDLDLQVIEAFANGTVKKGMLFSKDKQKTYPIIHGIPRFVNQESYAGSFGFEWKKWARVQFEDENLGRPMEGHTRKMFFQITNFTPADIKDKIVIEFGCGSGRFLDIVRKNGGIAVGLDLTAAVESAKQNFLNDPDTLIVQGDLFHPPFKPNSFDLGYTLGVLHHTPEPAQGLQQLVRVMKTGAKVACCVYPKQEWYDYPVLTTYRTFFQHVKERYGSYWSNALAMYYAHLSAYAFTPIAHHLSRFTPLRAFLQTMQQKYLVTLPLPDRRWRVLDIFDAITPFYASTHSAEEVRQWFETAHCLDIHQTNWSETSFVGIKS